MSLRSAKQEEVSVNRMILFGIGAGIGLVLLILSGMSFYTAVQWGGIDRDGATLGWSVVGFFLLLAGLGSIGATANHVFRELDRPSDFHH